MFPAAAWLVLLVAPALAWATGDQIQETAEGDVSKLGACFRGSSVEAGGLNLGQRWGDPTPTASLLIDLRTVTSAASSFDFRTFDPEGVIFYGDTSPSIDWFVLALRQGKPIMQIHNTLTNITVSGGRHLDDGQWHRITVKNEGHFVMLLVDGDDQLTLSHVFHPIVNQPTPQMRIGVGGLFILPNELLVPVRWILLPPLVSVPQDQKTAPKLEKPCPKVNQNNFIPLGFIRTTTLQVPRTPSLWGGGSHRRCTQPYHPHPLTWFVVSPPIQDLMAELGNQTVLLLPLPEGGCLDTPLLLRLTPSSFTLLLGNTEISKPTPKAEFESLQQLWLSNMGSLVIGGESGEEKSQEGHFFQGCLSAIRVQGHELDFDEAQYRSNSILAHSCPGSVEGKVNRDNGR
ncbi:sex hormone-binding globulin-like [Pseudonaja textilis]|uniref:sex hormone-binding globulin-like n=1 Tax=Pseudonaja textilis TaxID=8673 RepID=UPI000EA99F43|nr:sex hormone-binding globulin-like [Pseudonaja textilis]